MGNFKFCSKIVQLRSPLEFLDNSNRALELPFCSSKSSSISPPMTTIPFSVGEVTIVGFTRPNGRSGPKDKISFDNVHNFLHFLDLVQLKKKEEK